MTKRKNGQPTKGAKSGKKADYEVGYGKPPMHSRFAPGQSGYKGRKRKKPEAHTEMISRILSEEVEVGGQTMSKVELAIQQALNRTIKSGNIRDLAQLLSIMKEYGIQTETDKAAEMEAAAQSAMQKITTAVDRMLNIDPADSAALEEFENEEIRVIMNCANCSDALRAMWKGDDYRALVKRQSETSLHKKVMDRKT